MEFKLDFNNLFLRIFERKLYKTRQMDASREFIGVRLWIVPLKTHIELVITAKAHWVACYFTIKYMLNLCQTS
jgi:hypothetical protein